MSRIYIYTFIMSKYNNITFMLSLFVIQTIMYLQSYSYACYRLHICMTRYMHIYVVVPILKVFQFSIGCKFTSLFICKLQITYAICMQLGISVCTYIGGGTYLFQKFFEFSIWCKCILHLFYFFLNLKVHLLIWQKRLLHYIFHLFIYCWGK